jgi:hypothetical protein
MAILSRDNKVIVRKNCPPLPRGWAAAKEENQAMTATIPTVDYDLLFKLAKQVSPLCCP